MEDQVVQQTPEQLEEQKQVNLAANNLILMRKRLETEEREKKAALNRAEQAERALQERNSRQGSVSEEDEDPRDKEYQLMQHRLASLEVDLVASELKDFKKIVNDENLAILEKLYPDEYNSIRYNPDAKQKSRTAYNIISNYGIAKLNEDTSTIQKAHDRIEENKKKPTAASLGTAQQGSTPLARLDEYGRRRLNDEDRDRIMKEVALKKRMS